MEGMLLLFIIRTLPSETTNENYQPTTRTSLGGFVAACCNCWVFLDLAETTQVIAFVVKKVKPEKQQRPR
jgi:hypothetical protein